MPSVLTPWAASRVPVYLDTTEMDLPAQVNKTMNANEGKK